eukprot:scaffold226197_cov17-Tisochrysis_lutea.AAC.1
MHTVSGLRRLFFSLPGYGWPLCKRGALAEMLKLSQRLKGGSRVSWAGPLSSSVKGALGGGQLAGIDF